MARFSSGKRLPGGTKKKKLPPMVLDGVDVKALINITNLKPYVDKPIYELGGQITAATARNKHRNNEH